MSEEAAAYNQKKEVKIYKRSAEPYVVQAFCNCGQEFAMQSALTQGEKTEYNYQCSCGNTYKSNEIYPRVELELPSRDGTMKKTVIMLPIALYPTTS
jgi:hypothetical protein